MKTLMKLCLALLVLLTAPGISPAAERLPDFKGTLNGTKFGTLTNGKYCTYVSATKTVICDTTGGSISDTAYDATAWDGVTTIAPSKNAVRDELEKKLTLTAGTLTDTYICTYTAAGTLLSCNTNPATFQAALTYPVTGVATPTAGYFTKWGASGNAIVDGPKLGTLTDTKWCKFTTADGLACTESAPGGADLTAPGPIGGTTPGAGTFTDLKATTKISVPVISDTTLSGTPIVITIYDQATNTPYYFKAYPTKP